MADSRRVQEWPANLILAGPPSALNGSSVCGKLRYYLVTVVIAMTVLDDSPPPGCATPDGAVAFVDSIFFLFF